MSRLTSAIADDLVLRFGVGEGGLEFLLPVAVGGKAMPGLASRLACSLDHVAGQIDHGAGHALLLLGPRRRPELGKLRGRFARPDVFLHEVDQRDRHEHPHGVGELEDQVLFLLRPLVQKLHAAVDADAVGQVDDQVPFAQLQKAVDGPRFVGPPPRASRRSSRAPKQLLVAQHQDRLPRPAGNRG